MKSAGRKTDQRPERADYGLLAQKRPSYGAECSSSPSNLVVHIPCDPDELEACPTSALLDASDEQVDSENDEAEECREGFCLS